MGTRFRVKSDLCLQARSLPGQLGWVHGDIGSAVQLAAVETGGGLAISRIKGTTSTQ